MMMLYAIGALTIPLFNVAVWLLIFMNRKFNKLTKAYFYWSFLITGWSIGYAITLSGVYGKDTTLFWNRLCHGFASLIPLGFLNFVYQLTDTPRKKSERMLLIALVVSISLVTLDFTPYFIKDLWQMGAFRYQPLGGPFYLYFTAVFFFFTIYAFFILYKKISISSGTQKQQLKIFFIGSLIAYTGGFNLFFQGFGISVDPVGVFFVSSYVLFTGYAIYKHQFLDVRLVIRKSIFYSTFAFLISLFYVLLITAFQKLFMGSKFVYADIIINIIVVLILAALFQPIEIRLRKLLDRRFFKGTISEISEQKQKLESELERQQRLKSVGILAAGMAHEIKNPITAIQTFVDYLPSKHDDPEFREKFQRIATQELGRIRKTVTELLQFSKPSEPVYRECDLSSLLKDLTELLSGDLLKHNIHLSHNLDNQSFKVNVDPQQMKQAFLNLLLNAMDAMKETGGDLSVRTKVIADHIEITIEDTGPGIPPDKIKHIFDPFYTDKEGGTGLGLAVTHSIIEKNKGKISVQSRVGQGTEFRIYLKWKMAG